MSVLYGAAICSVALSIPFTLLALGFFAYRACSVDEDIDENDPSFMAWDGPVIYKDYDCSTEVPDVRITSKENYIPGFAPLPHKSIASEVAKRLGTPLPPDPDAQRIALAKERVRRNNPATLTPTRTTRQVEPLRRVADRKKTETDHNLEILNL